MNFFPFFIIAGGLYCVLILVEFESIRVLLEKEPRLIYSTYQARLCIPQIYFLSVESLISNKSYGLAGLYNGFTPVPNLKAADISLLNYLHTMKEIFYDPSIRPLLSDEQFSELFQSYPNVNFKMDMGIVSAIGLFRIESSFIVNNDIPIGSQATNTFHTLTSNVAGSLKTLSLSIYQYSDNHMQGLLTDFLIYVSAFCVGHTIVYLLYYGPHLRREERVLKTLKKLMEYIPSTAIKNSKISGINIIPEEKVLVE